MGDEPSIRSIARVTGVIWITSLEESEKGVTRRILEDLEPVLFAHSVPFQEFEPKSATELIRFLKNVASQARSDGIKPILHFDTHGNAHAGVYIMESKEFIPWDHLATLFRDINTATENNLCIISMACYGLNVVKQIKFDRLIPFYLLAAPPDQVYPDFIADNTVSFYDDVFTRMDMVSSYEVHLASKMQLFHCERLLFRAVGGYVLEKCMGKGGRQRIEDILTTARQARLRNNTRSLRNERRLLKRATKPTQELLDRWAKRLLGSKPISFTMADVIRHAEEESARRGKQGRSRQ